MWHRVAALLGMSVARAQEEITSAEFVDWCAFYSLEPWGCEVEHWRMGVLASTVANFSGHAKKHVKPRDFIPRDAKPRRLTTEESKAYLKAIVERNQNSG